MSAYGWLLCAAVVGAVVGVSAALGQSGAATPPQTVEDALHDGMAVARRGVVGRGRQREQRRDERESERPDGSHRAQSTMKRIGPPWA